MSIRPQELLIQNVFFEFFSHVFVRFEDKRRPKVWGNVFGPEQMFGKPKILIDIKS